MDENQITKRERYELILDTVVRMISESNNGGEEFKLYSENQLAKKLGVSRANVREVYSALSIFGILESRQGEGTFFKISDNPALVYKMAFLMIFQRTANVDDIMELRSIVEEGAAEKAAMSRTEQDIRDMVDCLEKMENCHDADTMSQLDNRLHTTIGRSCGNPILAELLNMLSGLVIEPIREHWNYIISTGDATARSKSIEQHKDLVDSIANQKPYISKAVAQEHLRFVTMSLNRYRQRFQ